LWNYIFPIAPLPEQRAIVSKIEQLFSDLDNGIENFKKAQAQLKLYHRSVLKAACEGKLVPAEAELAHAEGRDYEPADVLLARILKERRENWNGKGKYIEPTALETSGLPNLPQGWEWVSIEQVTECLDHMRIPVNKKERDKRKGNIPYYGANGLVDYIDDYIFDEPLILIVEDETFIGRKKPFCYKITGKSWVNNHAHILRANNAVNVDFLNYSLMYYPFTPLTTGTTGRKKLTKSVLMQAPYSLPPLAEQRRIVAEVEHCLSVSDKMQETITQSLQKAKALRQSILKKAFEGKLLNKKELEKARNSSDWEPAEKLLERIKADKMNIKKDKK
jgi:type I restriction enzyme S subunit